MPVRLRQEVHAPPWRAGNVALNRAPDLATHLASCLFRERVEGRLGLVLRRLVSRHMGLGLVLVRLRFLFFLSSCLFT
jgi:hypothetical protein